MGAIFLVYMAGYVDLKQPSDILVWAPTEPVAELCIETPIDQAIDGQIRTIITENPNVIMFL